MPKKYCTKCGQVTPHKIKLGYRSDEYLRAIDFLTAGLAMSTKIKGYECKYCGKEIRKHK